jgi:hypothetical protein
LAVLSYFREGALEKGERREYAKRGTEVSLGHKCTGEVKEGRRSRLYFFRQLSGGEVSKDLTCCLAVVSKDLG